MVPVEEENWEKPPFSAVVEDGVMWGRGTLDTKVTFNGILSAADALISQGFTPENDIYFAFSGGEEVAGRGAVNIVNWFGEHGIVPALVLDEGWRRVVNGPPPGRARRSLPTSWCSVPTAGITGTCPTGYTGSPPWT